MADDPKTVLHRYLRGQREALRWKLDGLDDYDIRRPMTPTGTNLLGLVKHCAGVEAGYFGECFGRPLPDLPAWYAAMDDEPNIDLWATESESRADILELHERVAGHADALIDELDLDATGTVPWWGERGRDVPLHLLLVHVITDLARHAGHADILRETVDGAVGMRPSAPNMPDGDADYWQRHRIRLQETAERFR
ncbi:DinB family protein [Knoellia locipacati]|uniref:DinB family protein n=1 Tax=Knoellia locipacati TaxID=882824 RepID=UPI00384ED957